MKKTTKITLITLILSLLVTFISCGDKSKEVAQLNKSNTATDNIGSGASDGTVKLANLDYNIVWIGEFHNGIAEFAIHKDDGTYWTGTSSPFGEKQWNGTYYYGYLDINGNIIVEPEYKYASDTSEGAFKVSNPYKKNYQTYYTYKIFDIKGNELVSSDDEGVVNIGDISNGMYWVITKEELLSGNVYTTTYYDISGAEKFKFQNAMPGNSSNFEPGNFNDAGYAIISINNVGYVIDKNGSILEFDFSEITGHASDRSFYSWEDDLYCVFVSSSSSSRYGFYGYIDITSMKVTQVRPEHLYAETAKEKFTKAMPAFDGASVGEIQISVEEDVAVVPLSNTNGVNFYAIININGEQLMAPNKKFNNVGRFENGMAVAQDASSSKWGYIDTKGEWLIEPQYEVATDFTNGYAVVNHITVIDKNQKIILDATKTES